MRAGSSPRPRAVIGAIADPDRGYGSAAAGLQPGLSRDRRSASTRHFVEGEVTEVEPSGRTGTIEGTITTILCLDGEESEHTFTTEYAALFVRSSDNELRLVGRYAIAGGTGTFADLSGSGRLRGSLTCLPMTLQNQGAESCEDLGVYADAVLRLSGTYEDPTVDTG